MVNQLTYDELLDALRHKWVAVCLSRQDIKRISVRPRPIADAASAKAEAYWRERVKPLVEAAQTIYRVAKRSVGPPRDDDLCPHGNGAFYPTHGLWCDVCWQALYDAFAPFCEEAPDAT